MIIFTNSKSFILSKLEGIKLTKLYYSIGEVASIFDVNTSLIRFWEKEFSQIQPKKNKKGERLFTVKDIELFNKIYQLVKGEGYTLDGAKKALKSKSPALKSEDNATNHSELITKLEKIKEQLLLLKQTN
ncbi:MAG: MerR family transcriptional regulator [Fluviicola sp.]|nr:MerR family transcriptional regulator [Fluviicola sp.]MBP6271095.1 MerR family transcriptional regulator [Fluviicola sp.]